MYQRKGQLKEMRCIYSFSFETKTFIGFYAKIYMKVSDESGIPTLARFPPKKIVVCYFVVARLFQPAVVVAEY